MIKYKILVLTDHSEHSVENSIYAILHEMVGHEKCGRIDLVSRGIIENKAFFENRDASNIFGICIDHEFKYSQDSSYYKRGLSKLNLDDYDIIFMRLPRPISDNWLEWLGEVAKDKVFINNPHGIIKTSNKKYLLNFPDLCPDMMLCNSKEDVLKMSRKYPIVLKPLKEYGGKGIVKIVENIVDVGDKVMDLETYLETVNKELTTDGFLAMKFLKNVSQGDKRILVVGGQIMASSLRLPAEGSWLCNVAQGGKSVKAEVTNEEIKIVKGLTPKLIKEGVLIFGADTLEDDEGKRILSEVNTLSIGGFPQAQKQSGKPIIKMTIDKIFDYADEYK
jgi:glutathione synthase